jgi:hypothetical protein
MKVIVNDKKLLHYFLGDPYGIYCNLSSIKSFCLLWAWVTNSNVLPHV